MSFSYKFLGLTIANHGGLSIIKYKDTPIFIRVGKRFMITNKDFA